MVRYHVLAMGGSKIVA